MITIGSILIGGLICIVAACGFFINIFVFIAIVKGDFLKAGSNVMYLMTCNLLISDTIQLSTQFFYLAPASVLQREIRFLTDLDLSRFGGFVSLWMWNIGGLMLTLLSFNRLVQICYPDYIWIFTRKKTAVLCVVVWPICMLLTTTSQYLSPCCEFVISYPVYSYGYLTKPNTKNYSLSFVDTPSTCLFSLTTIINYSVIFFTVRATRLNLANGLSEKEHAKRRLKEYRFALQFVAISSFYTIAWISFQIYPTMVPPDQPKWFSIITITSIVNSSINSWVYVYFNPDINKACRKLVGATVVESTNYSAVNSALIRETTQ